MKQYFIKGGALTLGLMLAALVATGPAQAKLDLPEGTVFKGKKHKTLYYLSEDGKRYVFPNEKTYKSWYENFDDVVEVEDEDLSTVQLGGNVRYKPGSFLVKITTDPKVYAVSGNGRLRWVKNERLAKKLYGDYWSKLVDDVPDAFFINYQIDNPIEDEDEFDPADEEETNNTIDKNRKAAKRYIKKVKTRARTCQNLEKQFNKLQDRLSSIGVEIDGLGDAFLQTCVDNILDDNDNTEDDNGVVKDGKVRVCHRSDNGRRTITISKHAVKAHLRHGDKVGKCHDDDDDDDDNATTTPDIIAPVISNKSATASTTSAIVTWDTDEDATSHVYYATTTPVLDGEWKSETKDDLVTEHAITIDDLTQNTLYYYLVKSADADGNLAVSDEMTFTTDEEIVEDTTAPVISDILATPTSTTAIITWLTDELATSKVIYADTNVDTASSTLSVDSDTLVTLHSIELTGLATSTQYFYKVESKDADDNMATSDENSFLTD